MRGNGSGTVYGAYMYYNNTSGNGLFANNMIAQANGTGSTYGIYNTNTKNTKFFYNSVSITKGSTTIDNNVAYYNTGATTGNMLLNNIFSNTNGGYAAYFNSNTIDSTNYNCFYSTASNLVYWGSAVKADLIAYQSASGRDSKSVSFYPSYNDSINDLSLKPTSELVGIATTLPEVTTDVTGAIRGLYMPTIGAFELAEPVSRILNLKLYLQGLCGDSFAGIMNTAKNDMGEDNYSDPNIAEKISVLIFDASNFDPYDQTTAVVTTTENYLSTNGNVSLNVDKSLSGNYYIVIKTRNHLETWSAVPVSFTSKIISYNYTTDANKAFGNNQIQIGTSGSYAIYGGDVNQDGGIDSNDMGDIDNDSFNLATGYLLTDVNGDGGVDSNDMGIVDNNSFNLISISVPTP